MSGAWVARADGVAGKALSDFAQVTSDVVAVTDPLAAAKGADVIVDFTLPGATADVIRAARERGVALVSGTTGLDAADLDSLERLAAHVPVVHDRNMSAGIHAVAALARSATTLLGGDYDVEILEAHHNRKQDAPSGTALKLGEVIAAAAGSTLEVLRAPSREGRAEPRRPGSIGFSVVRGGGIAGEHTIYFVGEYDRIEITHRAADRRVFAEGALRAARWIVGREPGLYGFADVLGEH